MKTLTLTEEEANLLLASLWAVSPTGGGSPQFTLIRKVGDQLGNPEVNWRLVGNLQLVAVEEVRQATDA